MDAAENQELGGLMGSISDEEESRASGLQGPHFGSGSEPHLGDTQKLRRRPGH